MGAEYYRYASQKRQKTSHITPSSQLTATTSSNNADSNDKEEGTNQESSMEKCSIIDQSDQYLKPNGNSENREIIIEGHDDDDDDDDACFDDNVSQDSWE